MTVSEQGVFMALDKLQFAKRCMTEGSSLIPNHKTSPVWGRLDWRREMPKLVAVFRRLCFGSAHCALRRRRVRTYVYNTYTVTYKVKFGVVKS
jgi:hypothetical protein